MRYRIRFSYVVTVLFFLTSFGDTSRHSSHSGQKHSYPHSTRHSGTGSGGGYHHSNSNSGSTYSKPVNHGSHSYPESTGYSGTRSGGGYHDSYSSAGSGAGYSQPVNHGSHSYPPSTGYSGSNSGGNHVPKTGVSHFTVDHRYKTEVHHHYHYTPPQQIRYGSISHPVYHGQPPVYVYTYQESGSRFDNLLTGLALYNLGRMSANHHRDSYYDSYGHSRHEYRGVPDEECKLGIQKQNGEYEEARVDCMLMSSFILESGPPVTERVATSNSVVTTVTNMTHVGNGSNTSVVTVKTEKVTDALEVKGPSISVTPGMTCFMIRMYRNMPTMRKHVDCGLLQEYARSSLHRNAVTRLNPLKLSVNAVLLLSYYILT